MVAGHLREQNGYFQMILSWKNIDGKRKSKSISTGLPVKGNKKRAEAMLLKARREFNPDNLLENAKLKKNGTCGHPMPSFEVEIVNKDEKGKKRLCLNGKPYFFHGLLDQGYFSDGIFLPATPKGFEDDVLRMKECGFNDEEAQNALKPLLKNNVDKLFASDCKNALTGPVERCDISTVEKHLQVLSSDKELVYRLLSKELVKIAEEKNDRDYSALVELLQ